LICATRCAYPLSCDVTLMAFLFLFFSTLNFAIVSIQEVDNNNNPVPDRLFNSFAPTTTDSSVLATLTSSDDSFNPANANLTVLAAQGNSNNGSTLVSYILNVTDYAASSNDNSLIVTFLINGSPNFTFAFSNSNTGAKATANSTYSGAIFVFANSSQNASYTDGFTDSTNTTVFVNATIPLDFNSQTANFSNNIIVEGSLSTSPAMMTFAPALLVSAIAAVSMIAFNF
jgi:hypothetical protein